MILKFYVNLLTKSALRAIIIRMNNKKIIGATEYVCIGDNKNPVPARIDTGAKTTAIWADIIQTPKTAEDTLKYTLFNNENTVYETNDFKIVTVTSSNGTSEERYQVQMMMEIAGERFKTSVNLSDRGNNTYPVLVGRRCLAGRFLINPAIDNISLGAK